MERIENRIDQHRATIIGSITAAHFVLSVITLFLWGAVSMSRFDGEGPSDFEALLAHGAFAALNFPVIMIAQLLKAPVPGAWGWLLFLANSVLWGWAGWRAIRFWRSRRD